MRTLDEVIALLERVKTAVDGCAISEPEISGQLALAIFHLRKLSECLKAGQMKLEMKTSPGPPKIRAKKTTRKTTTTNTKK